jgi:hypothetical protein
MITNKGKNIIAKYLIGDAPAYASYLALGCGPKPRANINEKTNVSTGTLTGTVLSTGAPAVNGKFITPVTGLSSTVGLVVGMTVAKDSTDTQDGNFGASTTITSIDGPSRITVTSSDEHTAGLITFDTSGLASLLSVSSTEGLWIGAKVVLTSGTGQLASQQETIVTAISSSTNFTVTPAPTVELLNATLAIEIDPRKEVLDFEMFRVAISSRGYVNDNGVNKIVLTAQLPTEERYQITEVGVYSAGSNSIAGQYDSKTITAFSSDENWKLSLGNSLFAPSPSNPLNEVPFPDFQLSLINDINNITTNALAVKTSTTNNIFLNSVRAERYESPRFLNNVFLLKSNSSQIFTEFFNENSRLRIQDGANFLQLSGTSVDLSKNSVSDIMKLAFSIVSVTGGSPDLADVPDFARVVLEFANFDNSKTATLEINASNDRLDFSNNRYVVAEKRLDELVYSDGGQFSWRDVSVIRVYASATDRINVTSQSTDLTKATISTGAVSHKLNVNDYVFLSGTSGSEFAKLNGIWKVTDVVDEYTFKFATTIDTANGAVIGGIVDVASKNYFIALDALRLDNVSTANPLYGLTGYSIIQNTDETPIIKSPNTNNYIEYRFILDVT